MIDWLAIFTSPVHNEQWSHGLPEEEVPGHVSGVGETGLSDLCPDGVDDGRLLFVGKQVSYGPWNDELCQVDKIVSLNQLFLSQQQQDVLSLDTVDWGIKWLITWMIEW